MEQGTAVCLLQTNGDIVSKPKKRANDDGSNLFIGRLNLHPSQGVHGLNNDIRRSLRIRLYQGRMQFWKLVIQPGLGNFV